MAEGDSVLDRRTYHSRCNGGQSFGNDENPVNVIVSPEINDRSAIVW
jgi:hypothetical protein